MKTFSMRTGDAALPQLPPDHSYIWPDQMNRIRRLEAAIEIARVAACVIEKMRGAKWLEAHLRNSFAGAATVVFQSAVWQYIPESERQRIITIFADARKRASEDAPLAWLRMGAIDNTFEIRLRIYPGFKEHHGYLACPCSIRALASAIRQVSMAVRFAAPHRCLTKLRAVTA